MPSPGGRPSTPSGSLPGLLARLVAIAALAVAAGGLALATTAGPAGGAEGMTILCDRADYGCVDGTGYRGQSYWGANYGRVGHNCTSYVSYRLAVAGASQPWFTMGNADEWNDKGRGKVPIDDRPTVGSVAQWEGGTRLAPGARGHVGYVERVTAEGIEVTDDSSSGGTRRYTIARGSPYWPDNFIHIHDAPVAPAMRTGWFSLVARHALWALQRGMASPDFAFGGEGDLPVAGDWDGSGADTVGTFRDGHWILAHANRADPAERTEVTFGTAGDLPVAGDWDGDGVDTVGVFRDGTFLLTDDLDRLTVDHEVAFGAPGDVPVAGDWDGDGVDTVGVFRSGTWILSNGAHDNPLRTMTLRFGSAGDRPVVGNWDGRWGDSIGIFRDGAWLVRNSNTNGFEPFVALRLGTEGDLPVAGAWTGGRTLPGIAR